MSEGRDSILIIGTGFAGLGMGIRLKQAGIEDFTILERAGGVGGTWRDNRYPGAACDVQSHLYSFSFEPNPGWTRNFAAQPEILAYLERCADKYDLRRHICFDTAVTGATFDERDGMWTVETTRGPRRARVVVSGCGGLSRPAAPEIPGLDRFAGATFHSARWDAGHPLEGKTVAVIGTGASAIQIVPEIAPKVGKLLVYQRTPPWILPKDDFAIGPEAQRRFRALPAFQQLQRLGIYLRNELMAVGFVLEPRFLRLAQRLALRYLQSQVPDPALRAALTPRYTMGCKRILLSNDYYPALRRDNVELVTAPIDEVRAHGIATKDGRERAVDTILLCTGFQAAEQVAPFPVRGRGDVDLSERWKDGAEAYLGTSVSGFPNLFFLIGPNTGLGHNSMVYMIESQIAYVLSAIRAMRSRGLQWVDVRPEAQARYNEHLRRRLAGTVWASGCTSWYQTRSGKNTTLWPGFTAEFRMRTRRFDPGMYELVGEGGTRARAGLIDRALALSGG